MSAFPRDPRLDHRLNAPCPECACPQWVHTDRCLTKHIVEPPRGRQPATVTPCQCTMQADDFTLRPPHEVFGPVHKWGYTERSRS